MSSSGLSLRLPWCRAIRNVRASSACQSGDSENWSGTDRETKKNSWGWGKGSPSEWTRKHSLPSRSPLAALLRQGHFSPWTWEGAYLTAYGTAGPWRLALMPVTFVPTTALRGPGALHGLFIRGSRSAQEKISTLCRIKSLHLYFT